MRKKNVFQGLLLAVLLVMPLSVLQPVSAQAQTPLSISGWFTILWGDNFAGASSSEVFTLTTDGGQRITLLLDEKLAASLGGTLALDRQRVTIQGVQTLSAADQNGRVTVQVNAISFESSRQKNGAIGAGTVSGSQPFISIMCKFSDIAAEPNNLSYFQGMYSSAYPGLDHYWREVSYNTANIVGSNAVGWYTLPQPRSYYVYNNAFDFDRATQDCTGLADAAVNFANVTGINLMFNGELDGYAWGGGHIMTLDGVNKVWPMTWEPPWGYADITVISHEMGHAFGMPHSSGNYGQVYDNRWDIMSDGWTDCARSTDPTYGCLGEHTISYHKDKLGWIPAGQKYTALQNTNATVTLEQLALPTNNNYKMVQIPVNGSSTHFYTVEVRRQTGYDVKLNGQAVIIHEVDTTRAEPAHVIDIDGNGNTGDAGAMWTVGETFTDAANNLSVNILSSTATGFQVKVICACVSSSPPSTPTNFRVSGSTQNSVTLAWDDGIFETGYKIYKWSSVGGGWDFYYYATLGQSIATFTDTSLTCSSSYWYKVSAFNAYGEFARTDFVAANTITCQATPTWTPTITATSTSTRTRTFTPTLTKTATQTLTKTLTPTPTITRTPTLTATSTPSPTSTFTKTPTLTPTSTITKTPTLTTTSTITKTPTPTATIPVPWAGEYYNNQTLAGQPVLTRSDSDIHFDWLDGSPDPSVNADGFSARWTKTQSFTAGIYRFSIAYDDGGRLLIDDVLVYDGWSGPCCIQQTVDVTLSAGSHTVKMEMFEGTGEASAHLAWEDVTIPTVTPTRTVTPAPAAAAFKSIGAYDGWILESSENTSAGKTFNSTSAYFIVGDDATDKQYRGILHFDTSALPDNALITSATLKIKKQGMAGVDPFNTHGALLMDIRKPFFGVTAGLAASDFQAVANKLSAAAFRLGAVPVNGWYSALMGSASYAYINRSGPTQLRLRFTKDDNDDRNADYVLFYSGNAPAGNRPQLVITYVVP